MSMMAIWRHAHDGDISKSRWLVRLSAIIEDRLAADEPSAGCAAINAYLLEQMTIIAMSQKLA